MTTTDRRDTAEHVPDDNHAPCNYCNSMRFVLDPSGKLKHCPSCSGGPVFVPREIRGHEDVDERAGGA